MENTTNSLFHFNFHLFFWLGKQKMKIQTFLLLLLLLSSFLQIYDVRKTWSNEQRISVFISRKANP